jgi:hypothetical protein
VRAATVAALSSHSLADLTEHLGSSSVAPMVKNNREQGLGSYGLEVEPHI